MFGRAPSFAPPPPSPLKKAMKTKLYPKSRETSTLNNRNHILAGAENRQLCREDARRGRLQPIRMRHPPPSYLSKLWGGGGLGGQLGGGRLEGMGGGGSAVGGGCQGGGGFARPTTTTCIPPGGMCVWGGFGEAARGCCEAGAADG